MKIDLKEAIKAAEQFWEKFGTQTKFKTKDEYLTWVKEENSKFNNLPEGIQQLFLDQRKKSIQALLDKLEKETK